VAWVCYWALKKFRPVAIADIGNKGMKIVLAVLMFSFLGTTIYSIVLL
jgi:hypothetical protein